MGLAPSGSSLAGSAQPPNPARGQAICSTGPFQHLPKSPPAPGDTLCLSDISHSTTPGFISSLAFKARENIWLLVVSVFNPARIPEASKPLGPKMQGEQTQILNSISYLAIGISQYPLSNLICIICSTSRLYITVKWERLQLSRNNNKQLYCFFLLLYFSFFFCRAPGLAGSYFPWPVIKPWTAREFLYFCFLILSKYFGHNDKNLNNFKHTHDPTMVKKKKPTKLILPIFLSHFRLHISVHLLLYILPFSLIIKDFHVTRQTLLNEYIGAT